MRALLLIAVALAATLVPAIPAAAQVECPGVNLAPTLSSDRNPDGSPVRLSLDARGRYVPIVMIHGWTGRSTHARDRGGAFSALIDLTDNVGQKIKADRSLVGQLQRLPGTAVFTFDYHDFSARWVVEDPIGPALGRAIDCLYEQTGEQVILVAHSMGGLASREALRGRAEKVSSLVTFGTPQLGSDIASLVNDTLTAAALRTPWAALVKLILAVCGAQSTEKLETGTLCDLLPDAARAFDSQAGRALRTGSDELEALPPVPAGVYLDALAGSTTIEGGDVGWFGKRFGTAAVEMGDVIVSKRSAIRRGGNAEADNVVETRCRYTLNVFQAEVDGIGVALGQVVRGDVPQSIFKVHGPCFHGNLMRNQRLTNEATGRIAEDIDGRTATGPQPPLTAAPVVDDELPVCRDFVRMSDGEADVVLRRMQEAHDDTWPRLVAKYSVRVFCKLHPGRKIDGVYAPGSRANPVDGGEGPAPSCREWREMPDAEADAALLRVARERNDPDPKIATLRLSVGALCAAFPDKDIDAIYVG